jgi:lysophospholipase L1-like esterase
VIWLTVQHDALIPHDPAYVNYEIEAASARWPNLFIADMGSLFEGHPEWRSDGTHPNAEGQRQMATLIARALAPFRPSVAR